MRQPATPHHFHYIIPVWGRVFSQLFAEICLPMLLTKGNLKASADRLFDRFVIVTTWDDWAYMRKTPAIKTLLTIMKVEPILINGVIDTTNPHEAMSKCYDLAMRSKAVVPGKTYFIFLTPDSIWSEGAFKRLMELADQGYKVAMVGSLRANQETMSKILIEWLKKHPENPEMYAPKMMDMIFDHLHQLSRAHNFLSSTEFLNVWPSHVYWINDQDRQIVAHCFHMHPLMVLAPKGITKIGNTIDGDFLDKLPYPLKSYYVVQDDFMGFDMAPSERNWGQKLGPPSIRAIKTFSMLYVNPKHWHFFTKRITFSPDPDLKVPPEITVFVDGVVKKVYAQRYKSHLMQMFVKIASVVGLQGLLLRVLRKIRRLLIRN